MIRPVVRKLYHYLSRQHPKLFYGKLSWLFMSADRLGIEFLWHGDSVIWLWPWRRRPEECGRKWLSTSFQVTFHTLKDIDNLWEEYFTTCEKVTER